MTKRRQWGLLLLAGFFAGCATPCATLVDESCAMHGEGSLPCLQAKETGEKAGARDQRACRMALDLLRERGLKQK
jgi:hypothetical protein